MKAGLTTRQAEFLCYEGREALFGGAAGGGKSVAILAAALQFAEQPGYSALVLRRTHAQLAKSDSILSKAKEWLLGRADPAGRKVRWNGTEHKFTFPSGATLEFGHMDHEDSKHNYQGGSWAYVGVDEATQFTGPMLAYPRTRQRRPAGSLVPVRWRGASNPGGVGHYYVKERFVRKPDGRDPSTPERQFFPARLEDNPHIDREEYVATLRESGIDPLTLRQLLDGNWDAVADGRFKESWLQNRFRLLRGSLYSEGEVVLGITPEGEVSESARRFRLGDCRRFQTCDPASSEQEVSRKEHDPDWTALSTWLLTPEYDLLWLDLKRWRREVPDLVPLLEAEWDRWSPLLYVAIEAVASNQAVYQIAGRTKMNVDRVSPLGKDKLVRATPAMNWAKNGRLWLPEEADWLDDARSELLLFKGDGKTHDDVVDTLSYAVKAADELDAGSEAGPPMNLGGGVWWRGQ